MFDVGEIGRAARAVTSAIGRTEPVLNREQRRREAHLRRHGAGGRKVKRKRRGR